MAFLDELKARLVAQGMTGTNIGLGSGTLVPSNVGLSGGPTAFIVIVETGGSGAIRTHRGTPVERPTAQVSVRALDYMAARTMLKQAYDALGGADGLHNVTLSGTFYQSLTARQNITDIGGLDSAGRIMLVFNIDAVKQPS
jgi:hypothetical protein